MALKSNKLVKPQFVRRANVQKTVSAYSGSPDGRFAADNQQTCSLPCSDPQVARTSSSKSGAFAKVRSKERSDPVVVLLHFHFVSQTRRSKRLPRFSADFLDSLGKRFFHRCGRSARIFACISCNPKIETRLIWRLSLTQRYTSKLGVTLRILLPRLPQPSSDFRRELTLGSLFNELFSDWILVDWIRFSWFRRFLWIAFPLEKNCNFWSSNAKFSFSVSAIHNLHCCALFSIVIRPSRNLFAFQPPVAD